MEKEIGKRYVCKKKLGEGGMGSVYLVFDKKLERFWAAKACRQFLPEEFTVLKELDYYLFPRIVDLVYEEEAVYLIMDYIEGISLKEWRKNHFLEEEQLIKWAKELAKGLHFLHKINPQVCYMDCKPENIILTSGKELRMVDFGSVYIKGRGQQISGTAFYAPIEQRRREEKRIGPVTDVYGLGMTLYVLSGGKEVICRDKRKRLQVRAVNPRATRKWNRLIEKMTMINPEERIQTMEEVEGLLKDCENSKGIWNKTWLWRRKGNRLLIKKDIFYGMGKGLFLLFMGLLFLIYPGQGVVAEKQQEKLHVTLYDGKGNKLLIKDGYTWKTEEDILLKIDGSQFDNKPVTVKITCHNDQNSFCREYTFSYEKQEEKETGIVENNPAITYTKQ